MCAYDKKKDNLASFQNVIASFVCKKSPGQHEPIIFLVTVRTKTFKVFDLFKTFFYVFA